MHDTNPTNDNITAERRRNVILLKRVEELELRVQELENEGHEDEQYEQDIRDPDFNYGVGSEESARDDGGVTIEERESFERIAKAYLGDEETPNLGELRAWWVRTARDDFDTIAPKIEEYGGCDLAVMAEGMRGLCPVKTHPPRYYKAMACSFYLLGKISREFGAYEKGRWPSLDTLMDTSIYSFMIRRIRDFGGWPVPESDDGTQV